MFITPNPLPQLKKWPFTDYHLTERPEVLHGIGGGPVEVLSNRCTSIG